MNQGIYEVRPKLPLVQHRPALGIMGLQKCEVIGLGGFSRKRLLQAAQRARLHALFFEVVAKKADQLCSDCRRR